MLRIVTLTGADNSVEPKDLCDLSREFPFVEWGVLIGSGTGNRFPSLAWIRDLCEARANHDNGVKLSLHICGKYLEQIAVGQSTLLDDIGPGLHAFERCQLNWHGEKQRANVSENILQAFASLGTWDPQIIFQLDGVNDDLYHGAARRFGVAGLFDTSHGAGVLPESWPKSRTDIPCGWAGGIGPSNVEKAIREIADSAWPGVGHWIDMETKIRATDDDYFCLGKCRSVLEMATPFITG